MRSRFTRSSQWLLLVVFVLSLTGIASISGTPGIVRAQDSGSPESVEFIGFIQTLTDNHIVVNEQVIDITAAEINGLLEVGLAVRVEAILYPEGVLVATEVSVIEDGLLPGEFEVKGILESYGEATIVVSGLTFDITEAVIEDNLVVGDLVEVKGTLSEAGEWIAREVELAIPDDDEDDSDDDSPDDDDGVIEITGTLDEIGDNFIVVNGLTIDISDAVIEDTLVLGALVEVKVIVVDDQLVALSVENADDDDDDDDSDDSPGDDDDDDDDDDSPSDDDDDDSDDSPGDDDDDDSDDSPGDDDDDDGDDDSPRDDDDDDDDSDDSPGDDDDDDGDDSPSDDDDDDDGDDDSPSDDDDDDDDSDDSPSDDDDDDSDDSPGDDD